MEPDKIIYLIGRIRDRANQIIIKELQRNSLNNLAPSHGDILFALFRKGPLSMKELAEIINRKKPTVTTLVTKLIRAGYVLKKTSPLDERINIISLTDKGKDLKETLIKISGDLITQAYQGFSEEERYALTGMLTRLYSNL